MFKYALLDYVPQRYLRRASFDTLENDRFILDFKSGRRYATDKASRLIGTFPSIWPESFGIVGIEALAAGLPIVTTEIWAGSSYYNEDGKTGLIVPPQDPQALANAIRQILSDPELHKTMSANARKRADKFAVDKMPERYEEVYEFLRNKK